MEYPAYIHSGFWNAGHVQGIAVDKRRGYIYFSFTDILVKMTLGGELVGSVGGLLGHLGCLAYNADENRVYASLEYKNDAIGRDILKRRGFDGEQRDCFYIAVFDAGKIDRPDMDAENDGVMTCVYLKTVADDFSASVMNGGVMRAHRHGCSGMDGITFAPEIGGDGSRNFLYVAYGVYSDTERTDNDYQVILRYDISGWKRYEEPLRQENMHENGPVEPDAKYFVFTGNTNYGIQNLEYDPFTGNFIAAVYKGKKPQFPNYSMFIIDTSKKPRRVRLSGYDGDEGETLSLLEAGLFDEASGVYGWESKYGSTGLQSLGDGYFYISHNGRSGDSYFSEVYLYKWTGEPPCPFERV